MQNLMLLALCFVSVIVWPANRRVMKDGAKTEHLGLAISIFMSVIAIVIASFTGKCFISFPGSLLGFFNGIAYSVGFCLIICHCLKIGPSGPTTAINNLGVLFPVVLSLIVSIKTHPVQPVCAAGVLLTIFALVLMAFASTGSSGSVTSRWKVLVFLGWLFTGISLSAQYLSTHFDPDNSMAFTISGYLTSAAILLAVSARHKDLRLSRAAIRGGIINAAANIANVLLLFSVTRVIPGYIVFPLMQIVPILIMMLLSNFLYGERINRKGWAALLLSVIGIVLMYAQ